jgi:hypothetical protein
MSRKRKPKPHHTGDPTPPPLDPAQTDPTWGDEGGGGEYEGWPVTHGEPEPSAKEREKRGR